MATEQKQEESHQTTADEPKVSTPSPAGFVGLIEEQYNKIKEHAETYPHVWGSYLVVYGGFGLWFAYRWRKLRRTENNVRVLQDKLRKLVEAEESQSSSAVSDKKPPSS